MAQDTTAHNRKEDTGPWEAVNEFLKNNKNFAIDYTPEKFYFTKYMGGYLKRIK